MECSTLSTAEGLISAPLSHKGKVRELYDFGDHFLIIVTDRISAFDYILNPCIPGKGSILNRMSRFWFNETEDLIKNHMIKMEDFKEIIPDPLAREFLKDRMMLVKKADRILVECVVRGYLVGNGWRQYEKTGCVNGIKLPANLRKNQKLEAPIFTPAAKNDTGHDVDITFDEMCHSIGQELALKLKEKSLELYSRAQIFCEKKGILLADTKFEFGIYQGGLILIDEVFTPDSSRYWSLDKYTLDTDIDSMDKEPLRTFLANSGWDKNSKPDDLPECIVSETSKRYYDIYSRLIQND